MIREHSTLDMHRTFPPQIFWVGGDIFVIILL